MTMEARWDDGRSKGEGDIGKIGEEGTPHQLPKTCLRGFLPQAQTIPAIQIRLDKVIEKVELWKEKALIGKFIGIWLKERDLVRWMKRTWNPKGNYEMNLGYKGFFTIIFFTQ